MKHQASPLVPWRTFASAAPLRCLSIPIREICEVATPALLLFAFASITVPVHAQGCAQCLDSTRATPPAVQAAYRHAIYLLGGVGATVFIAGVYLLRRNP